MTGRFENIICMMRDTHKQDELIAQAIHIAKIHQAKLQLVLALDSLPANASMVMNSFSYIDSQQSMNDAADKWMEEQVATWSEKYPLSGKVVFGQPFVEVVHEVQAKKIDLVIKLSEDTFTDRLFGSEDMHLLRKCPCPVWLVHRGQSKQYNTVVAAVDVNYHYPDHEVSVRRKLNEEILRQAARVALLEFAQLHVVHVYEVFPEHILRDGFISIDEKRLEEDLVALKAEREAELNALVEQLSAELDDEVMDFLKPQCHLVHGNARVEVADKAKALNADAIVMGTVARLGVPGFIMGNTAEDVLNRIHCAVLALKPEGFVSPVK